VSLRKLIRRYRTRVLLALICAAGLVWLLYDTAPPKARHTALNEALRKGTIGNLTPEEYEALRRQLEWLVRAAGITDEIALNQPFQAGRLNIYTTTPAAYNVTYCATRNALYDAQLDAVFIDESIFKPDDYQSLLEASPYATLLSLNELPFQRVYLRFIILHELGHRQLHRYGGRVIDFVRPEDDSRLLRFEAEADQFAIYKLQVAYQRDTEDGGNLVASGMNDVLGLNDNAENSPGDQVWIDLVGMVTLMSTFDLFLPNPYAPFYEDRAHPTFLDRAKSLIRQALSSQGMNQRFRSVFMFLYRHVEREYEILKGSLTEVLTPVSIGDVAFDSNGLIVSAGDMSEVLSLPYDQLKPVDVRRTIALALTTQGPLHKVTEKSVTWSSPGFGAIMFRDDRRTYVALGGVWQPQETEIQRLFYDASFPQLVVPPQPAELAYFVTSSKTQTDQLYAFKNNRLLGTKALAIVTKDAVMQGAPERCELTLNTVTSNKIYFTISEKGTDGEASWFGIVALDPSTLQVSQVTNLQFTPELRGVSGSHLVVVPNEATEYCVLVKELNTPEQQGWITWLLSANEPPQQLAARPFLVSGTGDSLDSGLKHTFGVSLTHAFWLLPEQVVITSNADSVYVLDVPTKRVRLAFHPGDEGLQFRMSSNGMMAIYMQGGHKIYVWKK
jgi:hypothetical protein